MTRGCPEIGVGTANLTLFVANLTLKLTQLRFRKSFRYNRFDVTPMKKARCELTQRAFKWRIGDSTAEPTNDDTVTGYDESCQFDEAEGAKTGAILNGTPFDQLDFLSAVWIDLSDDVRETIVLLATGALSHCEEENDEASRRV